MGAIENIRKVVNDFLSQRPSIDRLMTEKVEDYILIEEQPLPIQIGAKIIYIGNLTIETETKFFNAWGNLLSLMASHVCNWELSSERKKDLLEKCDFKMLAEGSWMMEFIYRDKWFWKNIVKLIGDTVLKQQAYYLDVNKERKRLSWTNCSFNYFKRHITKEKLIQICFLIYMYNFDSVKKNLKLIMEKMNLKALSETYISFWLRNMAGLQGKFLHAQVPSPASVFADPPSEPRPEEKQIQNPNSSSQENKNG